MGRWFLPVFLESGGSLHIDEHVVDASLASPRAVRELIETYGFTFRRSLGQNFLVDGNVLRSIIRTADVRADDTIVEIGAGIGTLTRALASCAKRVLTIEIDTRLHPILHETMTHYDNIELLTLDALALDWRGLWQDYELTQAKVVANLPYYITSPLLVNLLTAELPWESLVVMMQREVAERLVAKPATKAYGTITVLASYYSNVEICQIVPPTVFMPQPAVDSAIVKFTMGRSKVEVVDSALLWQVIKAGFAQRRKTLINSLAATPLGGTIAKSTWRKILLECGIDPQRRAETLTMEDFVVLTNKLSDYYSTV
ncbi:MAG: 16S rRNA (adenine(1518)-N(6)/adenine(1519)-N(6))-dimethyltransferase RsmA [Firmicutes bacterium]|nr:16S rRNA (adenine(1518)-N(6)/adenine(1519)-N(6))-dimethyltransferase RsmA [Bacillota bacterium]